MKKKAYGYLRVSGHGQINGLGFDRQKEAIEDCAKNLNMEVVEYFQEEGVSGTLDETERQVFQQMIAEILKDGINTIIVEGLDRLAREYRIQETILVYLASKDISLIDSRTGEDVTRAIHDDPMKKALIQIQGVFAELEKGLLVKKLRNARRKIRKRVGKCEGRKGWNDNIDQKKKVLDAIRYFRRKPRGNRKRKTFVEVAQALNENNIKTLTGKDWTGPGVQNFIQRM